MTPQPKLTAYYDATCGRCSRLVAWIHRLDRHHAVATTPITPESVAASNPPLDYEACMREMHVVDNTGRVHRGWHAVARLARQFTPTLPLGIIGAIPPFSWICAALYRRVAATRHRPGEVPSCTIPKS